ncbi:MAG: LutC/YkgG family protein [Thermoguttaceae bacterium]
MLAHSTPRDAILGRIRSALQNRLENTSKLPMPAPVWPEEHLTIEDMTRRFTENLCAVHGEVVSCVTFSDAAEKIKALFAEQRICRVLLASQPLCMKMTNYFEEHNSECEFLASTGCPENVSADSLQNYDAALLAPEFLLSDTGSCLFYAATAFDRLAVYLPPISVIIATHSMLREHLPAVWKEMKPRLNAAQTGEFVIVTGPSRTADIEKILILGVHGPKRLVVFLVDSET